MIHKRIALESSGRINMLIETSRKMLLLMKYVEKHTEYPRKIHGNF